MLCNDAHLNEYLNSKIGIMIDCFELFPKNLISMKFLKINKKESSVFILLYKYNSVQNIQIETNE